MLTLTNPNPDMISKAQWEIILQQAGLASEIAMLEERCRGLERERAMVFTMLDRQKAEQRESLQLVSQVVEGVLQAILTYQRISDGRPETAPPFVSDYEDPGVKPSFDLDNFLRGYAQAKGRLDLLNSFSAEYMVRSCFAHHSCEEFASHVDEVWNAVVGEERGEPSEGGGESSENDDVEGSSEPETKEEDPLRARIRAYCEGKGKPDLEDETHFHVSWSLKCYKVSVESLADDVITRLVEEKFKIVEDLWAVEDFAKNYAKGQGKEALGNSLYCDLIGYDPQIRSIAQLQKHPERLGLAWRRVVMADSMFSTSGFTHLKS